MMAEAYYSEEHRCWFVPVSTELFDEDNTGPVEPCRLELKDGQLWITLLETRAEA